MSKILDLGVEQDHIESLTKANGISALSELIWNSLDADSTEIEVEFQKNSLGKYDAITISDNGHGLSYDKASEVFSKLGGSEKKFSSTSPKGRAYHGKEGKGRFKSLALGDLVKFESTFRNNGKFETFTITIDRNSLSKSEMDEPSEIESSKTGFVVRIFNVDDKNAEIALNKENREELEEKFASYWIGYPEFQIKINNRPFQFESLIKFSTEDKNHKIEINDLTYPVTIKIIEWSFENKKKTYFCNSKGIPFRETALGIRSSLPISIFIQSTYIEKLHRDNVLNIAELDELLQNVFNEAKKIARDYVRKRLHFYSKEYIQDLKKQGIYPYKTPAENVVEESKRQVFDIVALQVHEYLPSFDEQDKGGKQLTLSLIKEALENDSSSLSRILNEVVELPKDKREELAEILDKTTLSNVIDTMTEITNRLNFLNGLEQIIYDKDLNRNIKERKHLHKIIVNETWIFGDEYSYGVDDVTLKNVLQSYLKELGREDFEEVVNKEDNSELQIIPDVCLWQQFSLGSSGKENLVIELKRPTVNAGPNELLQIQLYAGKVVSDRRFPKAKTKWKFILVTKDINKDIEHQLKQQNRKYGHVIEGENHDVFVFNWGDIISEAKLRYEYIKEKLNINLEGNQEGLDYLKSKYVEYLPEKFDEESE